MFFSLWSEKWKWLLRLQRSSASKHDGSSITVVGGGVGGAGEWWAETDWAFSFTQMTRTQHRWVQGSTSSLWVDLQVFGVGLEGGGVQSQTATKQLLWSCRSSSLHVATHSFLVIYREILKLQQQELLAAKTLGNYIILCNSTLICVILHYSMYLYNYVTRLLYITLQTRGGEAAGAEPQQS